MKTILPIYAVAAILTVGLGRPASADATSDLAAIQAVYDRQCAFVLAQDYDGFAATLTSDFQSSARDGSSVDRDQDVAGLKAAYQSGYVEKTCTSVASNFVANADGSASVHLVEYGDLARPGASTVTVRMIADDVWVLQDNSWLLKSDAVESKMVYER